MRRSLRKLQRNGCFQFYSRSSQNSLGLVNVIQCSTFNSIVDLLLAYLRIFTLFLNSFFQFYSRSSRLLGFVSQLRIAMTFNSIVDLHDYVYRAVKSPVYFQFYSRSSDLATDLF